MLFCVDFLFTFFSVLYLDDSKCLGVNHTGISGSGVSGVMPITGGPEVTHFKIDLVSVKKAGLKTSGKRCRVLARNSVIQSSADINSTHPFHTFTYVQGLYYIRVSLCTFTKSPPGVASFCMANLRQTECSDVRQFSADSPKNAEACHFKAPADLTVNVTTTTRCDHYLPV